RSRAPATASRRRCMTLVTLRTSPRTGLGRRSRILSRWPLPRGSSAATASGRASWAGPPAGAVAPPRGRVGGGAQVPLPVYGRLTEDVAAGLLSPRLMADGQGAQRADPLRPVGHGGQRATGSWVLGKPCAGRGAVITKTGAGGLS